MKNPQGIKYIVVIILSFILGVWINGLFNLCLPIPESPVAPIPSTGDFLPSQTDIQRILVDRGYDIGPHGVDGVIGTNSRNAWDLAKIDEIYKECLARITKEPVKGPGQF